jgi:hypothetical protein
MGQLVRTTDEALAAKDQELEEMRQLLEQQSASLGSVAVGAAALGEILDHDEIIRQQRASLKHLEGEWREKLRCAEIEISIERAKIARERADVERRMRLLETSAGKEGGGAGKGDQAAKPTRGRWLTRLGLNDGDKS